LPAFWAAIGFSAGIILAERFGWFSLLSAILGLIYFRWQKAGLLSLFVPLGALGFLLSTVRLPDDVSALRNTNLLLLVEPLDTARLRVLGVERDGLVRASGTVRASGRWLSPRRPYLVSGHMGGDGVFRMAAVVPAEPYPVFSRARAWVREQLRKASSSPENFGLAVGFILGERELIPDPLLGNFRKTGLMHLLAISGLHVGLIFLILTMGFSFLPRHWSVSLASSLIWAYAFFVGASPSVIRAAIFITLFALAYLSGRKRDDLNTLGAAALATLAVNPAWINDLGFQLSYLATFGILYYMKGMRLPGGWASRWLLAPLLVTLSAQVFVAPLLLSQFGTLSLWAFPLNILEVPLLFLVMAEWALYFLFYPVRIAAPFAAVANLGLDLMRFSVNAVASVSSLQLRLTMPFWAMVLWWAGAIAVKPALIWLRKRIARG